MTTLITGATGVVGGAMLRHLSGREIAPAPWSAPRTAPPRCPDGARSR